MDFLKMPIFYLHPNDSTSENIARLHTLGYNVICLNPSHKPENIPSPIQETKCWSLEEIMTEFKKTCKESSAQTYLVRLKRVLNNNGDAFGLDELQEKGLKFLEDCKTLKYTTQKDLCVVIIKTLQVMCKNTDKYDAIFKNLVELADAETVNAAPSKQMSEKMEKINFDEIKENARTEKDMRKRIVSVLIANLPYFRTSSELVGMHFQKHETENYVDIEKKCIIIQKQKSEKCGIRNIPISDEVCSELNAYKNATGFKVLLEDIFKTANPSSTYSKWMARNFGFSTQAIRRKNVSEMNEKMDAAEKVSLSKKMGHSVKTQQTIYAIKS